MIIEASILSADFCRLGEQVRLMEESGAIARLHVDVMDGHFVPNLSIGLPVVESLHQHTGLPLAVHLMVSEPGRHVKEFAAAGASLIWVHLEACQHIHRDVQLLKELGVQAGIALNPGTPLASLEEILPDLDSVLLMSVNPGFGGQTFIPGALKRVRRLRELLGGLNLRCEIAVDGGVNERTAADVARAGADVLVIGSALFRHSGGPGRAAAAILGGVG
ncbi:MAG: ribulose-phosphate 3-epimerase [Chloroflexi bacterium]|nr:ribulose-phosphate 3-epimerase [Chloroflexota bacterium]MCL5108495.1 ribulose-phosphate 3-epimerase [Chloroflexota bacterium]